MIIQWWTGHDALRLVQHTPGKRLYTYVWRIFWRLFGNKFEHWAVSQNLVGHLNKFGINNVKINPMYSKCNDCDGCAHIPSESFRVLVYMPKPYKGLLGSNTAYVEWVYGFDIIREVMQEFPASWIIVDGSQDMCDVWPYVDCMIRPNRHDGLPRLVLEAQKLNVPYYWDNNFKPTTKKVLEFLHDQSKM